MDAAKAKALKLKAASAAKATGTVVPPAPVVTAPTKTYATIINRARGITTEKRAEMNKEKADKKAAGTKGATASAGTKGATASAGTKKTTWIRRVDPSNGALYYFNPKTKESKWELDEDEEEDEMPGLDYPTLESWLREAKGKGEALNNDKYPFTVKALRCLSKNSADNEVNEPPAEGSPEYNAHLKKQGTGGKRTRKNKSKKNKSRKNKL